VRTKVPPPPISGGTLLVTHDGTLAVAADPDRDRVSIVALNERTVLATILLKPGDEPGRVVEDDEGRVHVALRRGGAIASIDVASGTLLHRTPVCGAPRGIAYDPSTKSLHVACAGGELVKLPADGGAAALEATLDPDLRDVVVTPDGLVVSRFKSATLLEVGAAGSVTKSIIPKGIDRLSDDPSGAKVTEHVEPALAFRLLASKDGVSVLHQYDSTKVIDVTPTPSASPYYGVPPKVGGNCGGLVQPTVSVLTHHELSMGAPIQAPILAVDAAISPDGKWLALAHAGMRDPGAPSSSFRAPKSSLGRVSVVALSPAPDTSSTVRCVVPISDIDVTGQTTAVAFNPDVQTDGAAFVVQTREPAQLVVFANPTDVNGEVIVLGGVSVLDTGHELFHRDTGAGIAWASCHPEGAEDGRVWRFSSGDRRTQSVNVGILGTEPFHWDGDVKDVGSLMVQVFEQRMGGPHESPERVDALGSWLDSLEPPTRTVDPASPGAIRGRALFESDRVGCAGCHRGNKLTSNANAWVGTTEPGHSLQVPSLVGVGYRAPFLHDGRAATLRDRFDPRIGGGDAHGTTSGLSDSEITDVISYLESL
jgi:DNA-binding beta-propeller fold protein YncE/mono/diheme cytochrome c family protein